MLELKGSLHDVKRGWRDNEAYITLKVSDIPCNLDNLENKELRITLARWKNKRSLNANALLWLCIEVIASAIRADKWEVYLQLLRKYGKFTYICVKPGAVEAVKKQWRECEELGHININGDDAVQMLCYFGSSTYDTEEFSVLLDGTISEMKEIGVELPPDRMMQEALASWRGGTE